MTTEFMQIDVKFAIELSQAAEKEARETERFILLAIGAIYAYLTKRNSKILSTSHGSLSQQLPSLQPCEQWD